MFLNNKFRITLTILLVFAILTSFSGCFAEIQPVIENEERFAYTQLSTEEQVLYERMRMAVLNYDESITKGFGKLDVDTVGKVYEYLLFDYPELFWIADNGTVYYEEDDDGEISVTEFEFEYEMSDEERRISESQIATVTQPFLSEALALPTDYEKVLSAYEYIIELCDYDNETYDMVISGNIDDVSLRSYSVLGVFIDNKAVCTGYAKAFQYLLDKMDIPVIYVNGESGGQRHVWNEVCIDGEWYCIDITWGDMVLADGSEQLGISYNYFGLTTEELLRSHTIASPLTLPECTQTRYNYYRYNNLFVDSYSFEAVEGIISSAIENKEKTAQIKFASVDDLKTASDELFIHQRIFEIFKNYPEINVADSVRYITDEDNYILKVIIY